MVAFVAEWPSAIKFKGRGGVVAEPVENQMASTPPRGPARAATGLAPA
jgi:hypothetical protein